jgi:K+-sensing histidine kinase KdpD
MMIGDEFLLESAVNNVLQNAIEFSAASETVTVSVERDSKTVLAGILDEGPGFPITH